MNMCSTDCRSDEGVTVGLIDSIITISRILSSRDKSSESVRQALYDLQGDKDVIALINERGDL